jgi:predicted nucleic acid-binding protein
MKIVADTNIFLSVALEEESKRSIIKQTQGCDIYAPEILPYEMGNALSAMIKRKQIDKAEALSIFSVTQMIPVKLVKVDIPKALSIASSHNIYAYDAYFLQSALAASCAILSLDRKLANVAKEIDIEVIQLQ